MNQSCGREYVFTSLSEHKSELKDLGIEKIGVGTLTSTVSVTMIVYLKEGKRTFRNFMLIISYLETILMCEVDLFVQYPQRCSDGNPEAENLVGFESSIMYVSINELNNY